VCRSYSALNFGVIFFGTQCILRSPRAYTRTSGVRRDHREREHVHARQPLVKILTAKYAIKDYSRFHSLQLQRIISNDLHLQIELIVPDLR